MTIGRRNSTSLLIELVLEFQDDFILPAPGSKGRFIPILFVPQYPSSRGKPRQPTLGAQTSGGCLERQIFEEQYPWIFWSSHGRCEQRKLASDA